MRAVFRGLRIDGQRNRVSGRVGQQLEWGLRRAQGASIDGDQVVAFLHLYARFRERGSRLRIPVLPGIDFFETVDAGGIVDVVVRTQQSDIDRMQFGIISAANIGVGVRKISDHLAHQVSHVITAGRVGQERCVLFALFFPIDTVHGRLEEKVAFLPPDFVEHLLPLLRRIDLAAQPSQIQRTISDLLGRVGLSVDNSVGARPCRPTIRLRPATLIQQLGAIEGNRELLYVFDENLVLAFLQIESVHCGCFSRQRS